MDNGTAVAALISAAFVGLIPAIIAYYKGKNFFEWWLYGTFLLIFALPIILFQKPNVAELERRKNRHGVPKRCPYCFELIQREAIVCKHCGRDIMKKCPYCAELVDTKAVICKHCKRNLQEA